MRIEKDIYQKYCLVLEKGKEKEIKKEKQYGGGDNIV